MPQATLQDIAPPPAPGTASLSDIQNPLPTAGTSSLSDIAAPVAPSVASVADIATPTPAPVPTPAPAPSVWDRVTNVVTQSPLAKSLGAFFDPDTIRAEWDGAGPALRNDPAYALRHAPITSPEAWKALFSVGGAKQLPSLANEAVNRASAVVTDSPVSPSAAMTGTEQRAHPIATATGDVAGSLASGGNAAILAATGGFGELGVAGKTLGRLVSAGFSITQLWDPAKTSPDVLNAIQAGDIPRAQYLLTKMGLQTGLAYVGAKHAATGKGAVTGKDATIPDTETRSQSTSNVQSIPADDPLAKILQAPVPNVREVDSEAAKQQSIAQDTVPAPTIPGTPTARVVTEAHIPPVSSGEVLTEAVQRIVDNSQELQKLGLDPEKIETRADVPAMLSCVADQIQANLDPRVGSVIGFDAQKALAADLNIDIDDLLARKSGATANAETALAARALLKSSQTRVMNLARVAAMGDEDYGTQFAQGLAQHQAILESVKGMAAEAGRALGSFRTPEGDLPLKNVSDVFAKLSPEALTKAAQLLSKLDENDAREVNSFVEQIKPASTADKIFEYYRNALLSSPKTVTVKASSELAMMALEATKKVVAAGISKLKGGEPDRFASEGWWYARGALTALQHVPDVISGKFDLADAPGFEGGATQAIKGITGKVVRFPSAILERQTNVMYMLNYFGELHAQAARAAIKEGLNGQNLYARQEYLASNPTPEMIDAAHQTALHGTFQNQLGTFGKGVQRTIQSIPRA
jgi:hypothetical protein